MVSPDRRGVERMHGGSSGVPTAVARPALALAVTGCTTVVALGGQLMQAGFEGHRLQDGCLCMQRPEINSSARGWWGRTANCSARSSACSVTMARRRTLCAGTTRAWKLWIRRTTAQSGSGPSDEHGPRWLWLRQWSVRLDVACN